MILNKHGQGTAEHALHETSLLSNGSGYSIGLSMQRGSDSLQMLVSYL